MSAATATKTLSPNGTALDADRDMGLYAVSKPITEPVEELPKLFDANGDTIKPMPTVKNQNFIQIPQWVFSTFGVFLLVVGFYAVSFYNQTNSKLEAMGEKINKLEASKEKEFDQKLQSAIDNALKRGYELKAAEGDHGKKEK